MRVVGTSLDDMSVDDFRDLALAAIQEHSTRTLKDEDWQEFAKRIDYVPLAAGPEGCAMRCCAWRRNPGDNELRLHYLSVPPKAALAAVNMIGAADLVERSRIIMAETVRHRLRVLPGRLNAQLHEVFDEGRSSGSTTSWARRRPRTSWPSASPMGSSSRSGTGTISTTFRSTSPRRSA